MGGLPEVPQDLQAIYKTVWEISQKTLINMAADRGAFIDQSQSFNVFIGQPNFAKLTSMHFYAWKRGLKTGMYYLRTRPKADAIQFTVDQEKLAADIKKKAEVSNEKSKGDGKENIRKNNSVKKLPLADPKVLAPPSMAKPLVDSATLGQAEDEEVCLNCGA